MRHAACCALALLTLAHPAAIRAEAEAVVRLAWPGALSVRCLVPFAEARLLVRCEKGPDDSVEAVAAIDSPLMSAGPLVPTGLLRELAGPLELSPGSGVFGEATGLRLNGSLPDSHGFSVRLTLVPRTFALFWLDPGEAEGVLGCTVAAAAGPVSLDAVVTAGETRADGPGEEWIREGPPRPGGREVHAASRISARWPGFSAAFSGGISVAERAPAGWFSLLAGSARGGIAGVDLLAAFASRTYLELGGKNDPGGLRAGMRAQLDGIAAHLSAEYAASAALPGFLPGPFLAMEQQLSISIERRWPVWCGTLEAGFAMTNSIDTDAAGSVRDDPLAAISAAWNSAGLRFRAGVGIERDAGMFAGVSAVAALRGGDGEAGGELRCDWSRSGGVCLDVSVHARFACCSGDCLLRAGLREAGQAGAEPWGSAEWRITNPAKAPHAAPAR